MANVLVFNNFLQEGQDSVLVHKTSNRNTYSSIGPGRWQADPYSQSKHIGLRDLINRVMASAVLWLRMRKFDVLIIDSATTGLLLGLFCVLWKGKTKIVVSSFNLPRRRNGIWRLIGKLAFRNLDYFFVHSKYDIELCRQVYGLEADNVSFRPFARSMPNRGVPSEKYLPEDGKPYILSIGSNARDYKTFMAAMTGLDLNAIVVAKEHNLAGLDIPKNVHAFTGLTLDECDRLMDSCHFTVFTFDGSEPSCGQISFVSSLMLGKPIVCTECEGAYDYVVEQENGLFVKMNDAITLREAISVLSCNEDLYSNLSLGVSDWSANHADPDKVSRTIDDVVTKLVGQDAQ